MLSNRSCYTRLKCKGCQWDMDSHKHGTASPENESRVPEACAKAYPCFESQGYVWVWIGEEDSAGRPFESRLSEIVRNTNKNESFRSMLDTLPSVTPQVTTSRINQKSLSLMFVPATKPANCMPISTISTFLWMPDCL